MQSVSQKPTQVISASSRMPAEEMPKKLFQNAKINIHIEYIIKYEISVGTMYNSSYEISVALALASSRLPAGEGGRLVRIPHIAGWWVGHGFKSKVVSDTTLGGCLNEKSGIIYFKMAFFSKNSPITKKWDFLLKIYHFLQKKSKKNPEKVIHFLLKSYRFYNGNYTIFHKKILLLQKGYNFY